MESAFLVGLIYVILVFVLLATRMWIATSLGAVGIFGLVFITGGNAVSMIGELLFNTANNFTYTMIPLFILLAELVNGTGLSKGLYDGASHWVGFIPGGLLHSNILSCAAFSAVSGSSMATAATIGAVAIPEMEKRNYNRRILYGSLAGGGTLGILIPPSLALVIYGSMVSESIGQLFIGGVIPGILLSGFFMVYIAVVSILWPNDMPPREKISLKKMIFSLKDIGPLILLMLMVLGTIYLGIASPTESAALGASMAFILGVLYRRMNWKVLKSSLVSALETSCYLMIIVLSAYLLSIAFSLERVPAILTSTVGNLNISRYAIWAILVLVYIILGAFIDGLSILLLTLPIVYPLMMALGFDSVWLGIVLIICIEMGQITPPVGVNLFVIHGITGKKYFKDIVYGAFPFFLIQIATIILLTVFPWLVTWLPSLMIQKF